MQLYEYAVIKKEKKDRTTDEIIDPARIIVQPDRMLAKDVSQVQLKIARQIDEADLEDADRIEILVRPF